MGKRNRSTTGRRGRAIAPALTGIIAAGALFAVAELLSAFFGTVSSPLTSMGSTFIDFTPSWMKNFAISTFGTNDKTVLLLSMAIATVILAAIAGLAAARKLIVGASMVVVFAAVMIATIITRSGATILDLVPVVIGTVAGLFVLRYLTLAAQRAWANQADPKNHDDTAHSPNRRSFILGAALIAGGSLVAGIGGNILSTARNTARQFRDALKLPAAKTKAAPLPEGVAVSVDGVVPFVTPNADFYRIDTALAVPQLDPNSWELRVHGMVENEFTMSFADLLASDLVESHVTLTCVSNTVGGNLVGNAKWLGYPLREVMARAKPKEGADMVLSTSSDGFSASTPLPTLQDDRGAILAVGMNDEPLPLEHGFPVRMVVPGLYGFVSATKWVVDLEVTTFAEKAGYWTSRGWSSHGPIKTSSRVEVPKALARVPAGQVAVGGTAWAQTRGISKVEVRLDNGQWQAAELGAEASLVTWRQWQFIWNDAKPGIHKVQVRAYDGAGTLQVEDQAPPEPDGSTGWHTITFNVV